ncbi:hypothetical protein [Aeromonas salmonicida]
MMPPKIAFIVGNGFSMSFASHAGITKEWNSQSFLDWPVISPNSEELLINLLPNLKKLKCSLQGEDDFTGFKYLQDSAYCERFSINQERCLIEARHYITIAFSYLSTQQKNRFDIDWSWYKWLDKHRDNIVGALSLNYDLLLENCFDRLRLPFHSGQMNGHGNGIVLYKPHGSVDFEIWGISMPKGYPLRGIAEMNNTPIIRLGADMLLSPRTQPLCIVPNENNKYKFFDFQWITPTNNEFLQSLRKCTHCVIVGISYFECDRPEIDEVLSHIPKSCEIIIANPNPPAEMIAKLKGYTYTLWSDYKGPIMEGGECIMLKDLNTGKRLTKCFCGSGKAYQHCCAI